MNGRRWVRLGGGVTSVFCGVGSRVRSIGWVRWWVARNSVVLPEALGSTLAVKKRCGVCGYGSGIFRAAALKCGLRLARREFGGVSQKSERT